MNEEQIQAMRSKARAAGGGGDFVRLDSPGEWVAGVVLAWQVVTTSFGEAEELVLSDPTVSGTKREGHLTFRLSRSVLKREFGSEADEPPKPGDAIYCEYQGERTGKSGRAYHAYSCSIERQTLSAKELKAELAKLFDATPVAGDDSDIPF